MPVTAKNTKVDEDGQEKDALEVLFTNGAKDQLNELQDYFKAPDLLEVVKLGISVLQRMKETHNKVKEEGQWDVQNNSWQNTL